MLDTIADAPVEVWPFGQRVQALRRAIGLSQNGLAHAAGIDAAYVNRIERAPDPMTFGPSRPIVFRLWLALSDDDDELDLLLADAGLVPETIVRAGGWEAYVRVWRARNTALERQVELSRAAGRRHARLVVARFRASRYSYVERS